MRLGRSGRLDRWRRLGGHILYWAVVLAVAGVLVFLFLRLLESRDESSLEGARRGQAAPAARAGSTFASQVNTTIRLARTR